MIPFSKTVLSTAFSKLPLKAGLAAALIAAGASAALPQSSTQRTPAPRAAAAQPAAPLSPELFSSPARFGYRDGEAIYRNVCAGCHMPDGRGAIGAGAYPSLASNDKLMSGGYPVYLVVNGQKAMPGFARQLDDNQVAAVVNYIRTNFGNSFTDPVSADDVKAARQ